MKEEHNPSSSELGPRATKAFQPREDFGVVPTQGRSSGSKHSHWGGWDDITPKGAQMGSLVDENNLRYYNDLWSPKGAWSTDSCIVPSWY